MIAARIAAVSAGESITLRARSRPCWRIPTLTAGRAKEAASMMPLEELPTIASAFPSRLQYVTALRLTKICVCARVLANSFVRSINA